MNNLNDIFPNFNFWQLINPFFLIGSIIYSLFALVVIKQIFSMTKAVSGPFNPLLRVFGFIHLALSIFVVLYMLSIL